MRCVVESLRPPEHGRPLVGEIVDGVAIVIVASAWGFWCGLDAESCAVAGARDCLIDAVRAGESDWRGALARAFAAASGAIDGLPPLDCEDDEFVQNTSLTCALIGQDRVEVAWTGGIVACVLGEHGIARETEPHSLLRKMIAAGSVAPEVLAHTPFDLSRVIARVVGPSHATDQAPEIVSWPPLAADERLLVVPHKVLGTLRSSLRDVRDFDGDWLRGALSANSPEHDRIGVLVAR